MKKIYVLDTSVYLSDFRALFAYGNNDIVIPLIVLEEIDNHKKRPDSVGINARSIIRTLDSYREKGSLFNGIRLKKNSGILYTKFVNTENLPPGFPKEIPDNQIIGTALSIKADNPNKKTIVVSCDINMRIKCDSIGLLSENYIPNHIIKERSQLYSGFTTVLVDDQVIDRFHKNEPITSNDFLNNNTKLYYNQYLMLLSSSNDKKTAIARYTDEKTPLKKIIENNKIWDIQPKNKEQAFAIDLLMDPNIPIVTLIGKAGSGKAQPLDAKIITPTGYKTIGEIKIGDKVITPTGKSVNVLGVFPQGKKEIFKVKFTDGSFTECCKEHLWETKTQTNRDKHENSSIKTLEEIIKTLRYGKYNKRNHSIPITSPVEFETNNYLPINPYLLGCLLGDGSFRSSLQFSNIDKQIINEISMLVNENGCTLKKRNNNCDYYIVNDKTISGCAFNYLKKEIKNLGLWMKLSCEKFIPHIYKISSIKNRILLLQGLMDTGGTINKTGKSITFSTSSKILSEDIKFLIESLGGTASSWIRETFYTYKNERKKGKLCYITNVVLPNHISPFKLERKKERISNRTKYFPRRYIDTVEYVGNKDAQCIMIDDEKHLYLTDNFIVTHNTLLSVAAGLQQIIVSPQRENNREGKRSKQEKTPTEGYSRLIVSRPIQPLGKDIGFLPGPQPLYSKILTPNGWKEMGEIQKNDYVIGKNGKKVKVLETFNKNEKEIYKVHFEDGAIVECCEDHPWFTYKPHEVKEKNGKIRSTKQIKIDLETNKTHLNHFIDFVKPVFFENKENILPLHPYILGTLLGDGCLMQPYSNELSSNDKEIIDRINLLLPVDVLLKHKSGLSYSFIMKENENRKHKIPNILNSLLKELKELNIKGTHNHNKFIPDKYLFSSIEDRLELLKGLMDTGGYCSKDGNDVSLTTVSEKLAENFKMLVLSLGGYANIKYSKLKNAYTISVSFWNGLNPFYLKRKHDLYHNRKIERIRKIIKIENTGLKTDMKCLLIDNEDHLYITNDYVLTHNTLEEKMAPWLSPIQDNLRFLFGNDQIMLTEYMDQGIIEIEALTYIRGRSIQNAFIIIDETQNLTRHEIKTILTRVGHGSKIILTGDIEQIDNVNVDETSNGLTHVIEKFKDQDVAGHITLLKGERSRVATISSQIL